MSEFNSPERCQQCPYIQDLGRHYDGHAQELDELSNKSPEEIEHIRDMAKDMLGAIGFQEDVVEEVFESVEDSRLRIIEQQMYTAEHMSELASLALAHSKGCPGTLTMRSTDSIGKTYKVTLCRSTSIPEGISSEDAVIIERR